MYRTSPLFIGLFIVYLILAACRTNEKLIRTVLQDDTEVFEFITQSILSEAAYTNENMFVSAFPLHSDTVINQDEWEYKIRHAKIHENRSNVIKKLNITEVNLDKYKSCNFEQLVPPSERQSNNEEKLPEFCQKFENKYAMAVSIPKRLKNEESLIIIAAVFSNYGYDYFKYTISVSTKLSIIKKEKIGWVYS